MSAKEGIRWAGVSVGAGQGWEEAALEPAGRHRQDTLCPLPPRSFLESRGQDVAYRALPPVHSLANGRMRALPGISALPWLPQELAQQLQVPFQLTHVHGGIAGGILGRIWEDRHRRAVYSCRPRCMRGPRLPWTLTPIASALIPKRTTRRLLA